MEQRARPGKTPERSTSDTPPAVLVLAVAKKVGLSFDEIDQLTLSEFFDLVDAIYGSGEEAGPRKATQDDIDRLFG